MFETLAIGVIVGIVLLFIEYKTHWFAQSLSPFQSENDNLWQTFKGKIFKSASKLEDQTADWLHVAEKIKEYLAQSMAEEINGPISLHTAKPTKNGALLEFSFYALDGCEHQIKMFVDGEGRIHQFKRSCSILLE